jgi:hypothetical protein
MQYMQWDYGHQRTSIGQGSISDLYLHTRDTGAFTTRNIQILSDMVRHPAGLAIPDQGLPRIGSGFFTSVSRWGFASWRRFFAIRRMGLWAIFQSMKASCTPGDTPK